MLRSDPSWSLYPFAPSKALPIIFGVLVLLLTLFHIERAFIRYSWQRFGGSMLFASAVWIAGFACRAVAAWNTQNIPIYISQYVLILAGPSLYAAAETFILGRLFAYLPYHAPMHPGRVLSTFIILSAVAEALAVGGASNAASSASNAKTEEEYQELHKTGNACVQAAMILQLAIEIFFSSLVAWLQLRCRRSFGDKGRSTPRNVKIMCAVLYVTSVMMMLRCALRAAEAFEAAACDPRAEGYDGYCGPVQRHEWFLWVFEVANITVFVAALAVFHPGKYLPADDKQFLDPRDARTERLGPGWSKTDNRSFIMTVLDPFDWNGKMMRAMRKGGGAGEDVKDTVQKFWLVDHPIAPQSFETGYGRRTRAGRQSEPKGDQTKLTDMA